ncbi:MAG: glycosyltransferase [Chitinophagaceae bacterium]|nr:glycosyltransferase [Chitinophagaceae bacterium]
MKVLLLPFNIASKGALTIDALNRINGVEAKGVFVNKNMKVASSEFARHFKGYSFRRNPIGWASTYIHKSLHIYKMIKWADVLHWIWDSGFSSQWDLKLARSLNKPGIIEWSGSDIRYPERALEINPYAHLSYNDNYEFKHIETVANSFRRQMKFSKLGFSPLVTPEMELYVRKELFPFSYRTLHRLNVHDFKVEIPKNTRPLVVHSPTCRVGKGTKYILEAIESLKKEYDFEFRLIENMSRKEAFEIVQHCDIFIDQLLTGTYGMASCEALSMGKPVLCYIMQAVYDNGLPLECPIVNTNPDNIKENLAMLLRDRSYREMLGQKGRVYAEQYLDVDIQAKDLVNIYKEVIARKTQAVK